MPPQTDVLQNGDFELPPPGWTTQPWIIISNATGNLPGWTGTDIEWGLQSLYIPSGSTPNRVIEMDGNGNGLITRIQQSFTIGGKVTGTLTFDMALRNGLSPNVGEGFVLDILDSAGEKVIPTQTFTPSGNTWLTQTVSVPFDTAGTYSIRFTEIGPNNSLGAIIDDISFLICFVAGTLIDTPDGPRRVEDLRPGDLVSTLDDLPQRVRWVGRRTVTRDEARRDPRLWPVTISAGAFGPDQPGRDLAVSRQHRILRTGWTCEMLFAEPEILVPAHKLVNDQTVRLSRPADDVIYVHFLCDRHEIVLAEGLATESFYPSQQTLSAVEAEAQAELLLIFPELAEHAARPLDLARPVVEGRMARLLA